MNCVRCAFCEESAEFYTLLLFVRLLLGVFSCVVVHILQKVAALMCTVE
jgi:hypothetical protein